MFKCINGIIVLQDDAVAEAMDSIHSALVVVNRYRKKRNAFTRMLWTPDYNDMTDTEVHAEGSYSFLSAMASGMSIANEKSLIGLLKAGYWAKTSYSVLRSVRNTCKNVVTMFKAISNPLPSLNSECRAIAKKRTRYETESCREAVVHGVDIGLGLSNLVSW